MPGDHLKKRKNRPAKLKRVLLFVCDRAHCPAYGRDPLKRVAGSEYPVCFSCNRKMRMSLNPRYRNKGV